VAPPVVTSKLNSRPNPVTTFCDQLLAGSRAVAAVRLLPEASADPMGVTCSWLTFQPIAPDISSFLGLTRVRRGILLELSEQRRKALEIERAGVWLPHGMSNLRLEAAIDDSQSGLYRRYGKERSRLLHVLSNLRLEGAVDSNVNPMRAGTRKKVVRSSWTSLLFTPDNRPVCNGLTPLSKSGVKCCALRGNSCRGSFCVFLKGWFEPRFVQNCGSGRAWTKLSH